MCVKLYSVPYFQRPYTDSDYMSSISRNIDDTTFTVYRPNHGVAHSLRQGFLARDIVTILLQRSDLNLHSSILYYHTESFSTRVSILSSFQRSGRQSEVSSNHNPSLYYSYERQDAVNFREAVDLEYFCCQGMLDTWSEYLSWDNRDTQYPLS
jgi:hypothetical protein